MFDKYNILNLFYIVLLFIFSIWLLITNNIKFKKIENQIEQLEERISVYENYVPIEFDSLSEVQLYCYGLNKLQEE